MKNKLVLWGENEANEKLLLALELITDKNEVKIYAFPLEVATQEFYDNMMEKWRNNQDVPFPEKHTIYDRPLSASDSLLPDDIKVDRTDLINRAQTEWQYIVLSDKLYQLFSSELADLEEKVDEMKSFSAQVWEEMKNFWDKVQTKIQDKDLYIEHAQELKKRTNKVFDNLKEMRKQMEQEFAAKSSEVKAEFMQKMDELEEKIDQKLGFKPIFQELKSLQNRLKNAKLTRSDNNTVWKRIDNGFKKLKNVHNEGDNKGEPKSALDRLKRRYDGLLNAINKMERSIKRDKGDLQFQDNRIENSYGQLERQLRQAKLAVIEERIKSKGEKLEDMMKTKAMLEDKMDKEKQREAQREADRLRKAKLKEAKEAAKEKIAAKIEEQKEDTEEMSDKLEAAAAEITGKESDTTPEADENDSIVEKVTESVASAIFSAKENIEEIAEDSEENIEVIKKKLEDIAASAGEKIADLIDDIRGEEE